MSLMEIELSSASEAIIVELMATGSYKSEPDIVEQALRLVRAWKDLQSARLRAAVQIGIDELDRGESVPWEEVGDELRALVVEKSQPAKA